MRIVILTFNIGNAGRYANGPGMTLFNLVKILKSHHEIKVFTQLQFPPFESVLSSSAIEAINNADVVIHWSGMLLSIVRLIKHANNLNKKVIIGPNVLDTVELDKEKTYLSSIKFNKVLTLNDRLKFLISHTHNISLEKIGILQVGPDLEEWAPTNQRNNKILWKGNSRHFVKDVGFILELQKLLPQYEFEILGYPKPYEYENHIEIAKQCKLFVCTSLSETMCLALLEQWTAGIPSVTHPKIYMHGQNYTTGIITNRDILSYREAITEIMENDNLYKSLSEGCVKFMNENFNKTKLLQSFEENILDIG
jgi:glycosyltransferase involved in cell wall biosynthesis